MPGYPCCCDDKNSLYVPCCLYGIGFQLFGRSLGGSGGIKLKHLYLENMDGDTSADHGSVMIYSEDWSGVMYGSLSWYDWGLPVTLENLFEAQPGGNWRIRMQFRNIGLETIGFELMDCTLNFSFFKPLGTGFAQTIQLYPESVGAAGWTDSINLLTPGGSSTISLASRSNSPEIVLVYGSIPYGDPGQVRTAIDVTRRPFLAFDFQEDGGSEIRKHCLEFLNSTTDPPRDNSGLELITSCDVSPPCVECSCRAARPLDQDTCDDCRCVSNTPVKLGGFGEVNPEPSIVDITGEDNGKGVGPEWTVYGHAKALGPFITDQTLIWTGYEDFQGNQPMTVLALTRTTTGWRLWLVGLDGNLTFLDAADPTVNGGWFLWWIVKKKVGQSVTYKFGIAPHAGGASISDTIEAADADFPGPGSDHGDWAILGDDPSVSLVPIAFRLDSSFAGCVDGLSFKDSAATDEEMLALANCSVSPSPPPDEDVLMGDTFITSDGLGIFYTTDGESTFYL
jgi:hypothetical protein